MKCIQKGWPISVALEIKVIFNRSEDKFGVWYPDTIEQQIELLEYGDRSTPPNAVIRPFMEDRLSKSQLTDDFFEKLEEDLVDSMGFEEWV